MSIEIPAVGVSAAVVPVGLLADRPKEDRPVGRNWDRTDRPVLRLISCGGSFDRGTGPYRDNVIVYTTAT